MLQPQLIAPFQTGLETDVEPWLAPPDSFREADNVHVRHGFLEKRSGYSIFGQLGTSSATVAISNITQATNGEVTTGVAHGFSTGDFIYITGVAGMIEINGKAFTITETAPTTFEVNFDTSGFTAYAGGGTAAAIDSDLDRVMGIYRFLASDGTKELLAFTTERAYLYSGVTKTFEPLDGANIMDGDEYDYIWVENWQSTALDNRMYFTNGKAFSGGLNGIRYYDGNGATTTDFNTNAISTTVTLYGGRLLFSLKQRLIVLSTFENNGISTSNFQQRARWCQAQGPSNWDETVAGGGGFVDCPTGDQIVSGRALQDVIVVNFTNSVWLLRPVNDPALPFRWEKVNNFRASDGKMATVGYDRDIKALGVRGITATDGVETRRIDNRIESFVVENINVNEFEKVFCERSYAEKRWWTLYANNEDDENSAALIWDDDSGAFTTYTISMNCLGYGNVEEDWSFDDFTAANNKDWRFVPEAGEDGPSEETFQSFYWLLAQDIFLGGNISGTIFEMETGGDDNNSVIETNMLGAGWNPFQQEGREAQLSYIDILVDTDISTIGTVEFYKDNAISPYKSQSINFLPQLTYISSIINVSNANPAVVNAPQHGLADGDIVYIYLVEGMTQINGGPYTVTVVNENNISLDGIDSSSFDTYTTSGQLFLREFYKTKTWKRAFGGGIGNLHQVRISTQGNDQPFRIHAFKPYFKAGGNRTIN